MTRAVRDDLEAPQTPDSGEIEAGDERKAFDEIATAGRIGDVLAKRYRWVTR